MNNSKHFFIRKRFSSQEAAPLLKFKDHEQDESQMLPLWKLNMVSCLGNFLFVANDKKVAIFWIVPLNASNSLIQNSTSTAIDKDFATYVNIFELTVTSTSSLNHASIVFVGKKPKTDGYDQNSHNFPALLCVCDDGSVILHVLYKDFEERFNNFTKQHNFALNFSKMQQNNKNLSKFDIKSLFFTDSVITLRNNSSTWSFSTANEWIAVGANSHNVSFHNLCEIYHEFENNEAQEPEIFKTIEKSHDNNVPCVDFSPNFSELFSQNDEMTLFLASASIDGSLKIWDMNSFLKFHKSQKEKQNLQKKIEILNSSIKQLQKSKESEDLDIFDAENQEKDSKTEIFQPIIMFSPSPPQNQPEGMRFHRDLDLLDWGWGCKWISVQKNTQSLKKGDNSLKFTVENSLLPPPSSPEEEEAVNSIDFGSLDIEEDDFVPDLEEEDEDIAAEHEDEEISEQPEAEDEEDDEEDEGFVAMEESSSSEASNQQETERRASLAMEEEPTRNLGARSTQIPPTNVIRPPQPQNLRRFDEARAILHQVLQNLQTQGTEQAESIAERLGFLDRLIESRSHQEAQPPQPENKPFLKINDPNNVLQKVSDGLTSINLESLLVFTTKQKIYLLDFPKMQILDKKSFSDQRNLIRGLGNALQKLSIVEFIPKLRLLLVSSQSDCIIKAFHVVSSSLNSKPKLNLIADLNCGHNFPIYGFAIQEKETNPPFSSSSGTTISSYLVHVVTVDCKIFCFEIAEKEEDQFDLV